MKIYIDSSNLLHIDERIYSDKVSLVFLRKGTTRFDIREVNTNNTILGKEVDIDVESVVNELGVAYASVDAIFTAIQSKLTNSISVLDPNGNVVSSSGVPHSDSLEITRPANTTAYSAFDCVGNPAAVKQKETLTFTGTSGTADVTLSGGLTKLVTFDTDIQQTVINFVSAVVNDYDAVGIAVTRNLEDVIFEAKVAGVPFVAPIINNVSGDLAGTVAHTTANVTLLPFEFEQICLNNGGGGFLMDVKIETNITAFAGKNFRVWIYNDTPTSPIGDNVAFTNAYADKNKLIGFVDVEMEALLTGSDSVVGQTSSIMKQYKCADTSLFVQLETIDAVTPTSGGKINITLNALKLS